MSLVLLFFIFFRGGAKKKNKRGGKKWERNQENRIEKEKKKVGKRGKKGEIFPSRSPLCLEGSDIKYGTICQLQLEIKMMNCGARAGLGSSFSSSARERGKRGEKSHFRGDNWGFRGIFEEIFGILGR